MMPILILNDGEYKLRPIVLCSARECVTVTVLVKRFHRCGSGDESDNPSGPETDIAFAR
jgi:hypothetical protein